MKIFKLSKDDPNTHTITNESDFLKLTGKKIVIGMILDPHHRY